MRHIGVALLALPLMVATLYWASGSGRHNQIFDSSYSMVLHALAPTRSRIDRSVARRFARLGVSSPITQDRFRRDQLRWSALAVGAGAVIVIVLHLTPWRAIILLAMSALIGVFLRDRQLTTEVKKHETRIAFQFPQVVELLALAVSAGESPMAALERLVIRGKGPLIVEFDSAMNLMRAGVPLVVALDEIARASGVAALRRFIDGVVVTLERGTPIAETLRMQANDVREERRRALLEASGKAEIAMMIPIVFLIMPITVLFALWPSITTLSSMSY